MAADAGGVLLLTEEQLACLKTVMELQEDRGVKGGKEFRWEWGVWGGASIHSDCIVIIGIKGVIL